MKIFLTTLLLSVFLNSYEQYYTPVQIENINLNKTAYEGDMYLDTIHNNYFIGLTNGKLAKIGSENYFIVAQSGHSLTIPSWGVLPLTYNQLTSKYEPALSDTIPNTFDLLMIDDLGTNILGVQNMGYLKVTHGLDVGYWWVLSHINAGGIERADTSNCNNDNSLIYQRLFYTVSPTQLLLQPEAPKDCAGAVSNYCVNPSLISVNDSLILVSPSSITKDTLLITGTNFTTSSILSISPMTNLTVNGYTIISGSQAEIYIDIDTSLGFPLSQNIYTVSVSTGSCLGNVSKNFIVFKDAIRESLSTSVAAYDAAPVNQLIEITLAEYTNMLSIIPSSQNNGTVGNPSPIAFGTRSAVTSNIPGVFTTLPANSYVAGVKFVTYQNITRHFRVTVSNSLTSATSCLTVTTPDITWAPYTFKYFAVKKPTINSGSSATTLGIDSRLRTCYSTTSSGINTRYTQSFNLCGTALSINHPYPIYLQVVSSTQKSW